MIKQYCRKDTTTSQFKILSNDPSKGFVTRDGKNKTSLLLDEKKEQNYSGFGKNGDEQLTERFNPNNVELNKRRF